MLFKTSSICVTALGCLLVGPAIASANSVHLAYQPMRGYLYHYKSHSDVKVTLAERTESEEPKNALNEQNCKVYFEVHLVSKRPDDSFLLKLVIGKVDTFGTEKNNWIDIKTKIALRKPIYFVQHPDGSLGEIYKAKGEKPHITNFKRSVIAAFQANLPSSGRDHGLQEVDPAGNLSVSRVWDENTNDGPTSPEALAAIRQHNGSLKGEHTVKMSAEEGVIKQMQFSVSLNVSKDVREDVAGLTRSETRVSNQSTMDLIGSRLLIVKPDFNPKCHELTTLEMENAPSEKPFKMPGDFKEAIAVLRDHPKAAERIGVEIKTKGSKLKKHLDLVSALAQEGSAASQAALVNYILADPKVEIPTLHRALLGLVNVKVPQSSTMNALMGFLNDQDAETRRAAVTSFGSLLGKMSAKEASQHTGALTAYALRPWDEKELMIALTALGNAGQAGCFETIASFLNHRSFLVRREAVDALRKYTSDNAMALLTEKASQDAHPAVRSRALQVLAMHMPVSSAPDQNTAVEQKWNKKMGLSDLHVAFAGHMRGMGNPAHVEMVQEMRARAWNVKTSVGRVEIMCDAAGNHQPSNTCCNAYIMGEKVYCSDRLQKSGSGTDDCEFSMETSWDSGPFDTGVGETTIPVVPGVDIKLKGSFSAQFAIYFKGLANVCDPNAVFAEATVVPAVTLSAMGGASVVFMGNIPVGVGVEAMIADGKLPFYAKLGFDNGKTFSGALKIDFALDQAAFKFNGQVATFQFPLLNLKQPAIQENLLDYKWPKQNPTF